MLGCQWAMRAYVFLCQGAYMPACLAGSHTHVSTFLTCLCVHIQTCFVGFHVHVPMCLVCLHALVPTSLACLCDHVLTYLTWLRAHVTKWFVDSRAYLPTCLGRFCASLASMPWMLMWSRVNVPNELTRKCSNIPWIPWLKWLELTCDQLPQ